MMKPTVGRIVHFWEREDQKEPYPAMIVYVHSDILVNLAVFDHSANVFPRLSIPLSSSVSSPHYSWSWMPYQVSKAAAGDHNSESAEPRPVSLDAPADPSLHE